MLYTQINWSLHNHCKAECSYCPSRYWGGDIPRGIEEYMAILEKIIDHYQKMDRKIRWFFDGGEPLEMHDFPMMLKYCKDRGGRISLTTNGGRKWLDWWAIEPHLDSLDLTYHYWQQENLVNYIIETFQKKRKPISVTVPIRPDFFESDLERSLRIERTYGIVVSKSQLYKEATHAGGLFDYTDDQLRIMSGEVLVEERIQYQQTSFAQKHQEIQMKSPVYTGKLCNVGIERLMISHDGWVTGSDCNNLHLGNIWDNTFSLPLGPSVCKMLACLSSSDQEITKFD